MMLGLGLCALMTIWSIGAVHLWRLQSASRSVGQLRWTDRLFALFWLPVALFFLMISLPQLVQSLFRRGRRRRPVQPPVMLAGRDQRLNKQQRASRSRV